MIFIGEPTHDIKYMINQKHLHIVGKLDNHAINIEENSHIDNRQIHYHQGQIHIMAVIQLLK